MLSRLLVTLLALTLLAVALPAATLAEAVAREDYVIEYMIPGAKDTVSTENEVGKVIYDKFGIIINVIGYAGDWEEKCALMLAAGDYPDMVQLQGNKMFLKYYEAGALLNIGELAEQYAPNFLKFHEQTIPYWKMVTGDGGLWKWEANTPDMECATGAMFDVLIRSDILEQQGYPKVLSTDSYVDLLKKGIEQNPDQNGEATVGMTFAGSEDWMIGCVTQSFDKARYTEVAGTGAVIWDSIDEQYIGMVEHPTYKEGMQFFNKLYQAGALDEECFTDTSSETTAKLQSGRALATWYITWEQGSVNRALRQLGLDDQQYVVMPIMMPSQIENGDKRMIRILDTYDWQTVVITKNAKDPQRLMELLDWASTEEGQVMLGWGIEGMHYTVNDQGLREVTPAYLEAREADSNFNDGLGTYYFLGLSAGYDKNQQIYNNIFDVSITNLNMTDRVKEVYRQYGWENITDPWQKNQDFGFDYVHTGLVGTVALSPESEAKKLENKLVDYRFKHTAKLCTAESDEAFEQAWQAFYDGYLAMNPQTVIDAYNDAYRVAKANFERFD